MKESSKEVVYGVAIFCAFALGLFAFIFVVNYVTAVKEAKHFNELTGSHVTVDQAFWLDLKVVKQPVK